MSPTLMIPTQESPLFTTFGRESKREFGFLERVRVISELSRVGVSGVSGVSERSRVNRCCVSTITPSVQVVER